jgi:hypothetical protein
VHLNALHFWGGDTTTINNGREWQSFISLDVLNTIHLYMCVCSKTWFIIVFFWYSRTLLGANRERKLYEDISNCSDSHLLLTQYFAWTFCSHVASSYPTRNNSLPDVTWTCSDSIWHRKDDSNQLTNQKDNWGPNVSWSVWPFLRLSSSLYSLTDMLTRARILHTRKDKRWN